MTLTNLNCKIEIFSSINPSEDPEKVKKAILNIIPRSEINIENYSIRGKTSDFHSMEKIYETIHSSKSQRAFQRQLEKHIDNNTTWFYLNKQAAYVERVVLCEEADESPLGPLKVVRKSTNIDRIIDNLVL